VIVWFSFLQFKVDELLRVKRALLLLWSEGFSIVFKIPISGSGYHTSTQKPEG
jgi:hypothetical protein